jgi:hypothetical protein
MMGGTCSSHGEMRNVYKLLVRKPEEKTWSRSDENVKENIQETGCENADMAQLV